MKDLNSSICRMFFIEELKKEIHEYNYSIEKTKNILDEEIELCEHDLVVYYGNNPLYDSMYQCLSCCTYYEIGDGGKFPYKNSTIIDVSNGHVCYPDSDTFNKIRNIMVEAFDNDPNITIDKFCDSLLINKTKKLGMIK